MVYNNYTIVYKAAHIACFSGHMGYLLSGNSTITPMAGIKGRVMTIMSLTVKPDIWQPVNCSLIKVITCM